MAFAPSDAYLIMGHGQEPNVTLEEKQCNCKIKAKQPTIGTRSNNGFMDLDSSFIVPDNCIIIVRARPGELSYSNIINPLLNKIGAAENQELFKDPLSNTKEIINQLGPVSIYKPGDRCPNFEYTLFFSRDNLNPAHHLISSHVGLVKTPLTSPIDLIDYNAKNKIINTINQIYGESVFPKKETINNVVLRNILKREPTDTETTTVKDMLAADKADCGKLIDYLQKFLSVTQKQLLKIGDDGIAGRPGVYYNFVCRYVNDKYYNRENVDYDDKVNPAITSIRQEPKPTQQLFSRILNETLRQRKPYIRNAYSIRTRRRRRSSSRRSKRHNRKK